MNSRETQRTCGSPTHGPSDLRPFPAFNEHRTGNIAPPRTVSRADLLTQSAGHTQGGFSPPQHNEHTHSGEPRNVGRSIGGLVEEGDKTHQSRCNQPLREVLCEESHGTVRVSTWQAKTEPHPETRSTSPPSLRSTRGSEVLVPSKSQRLSSSGKLECPG